MKKLMMLILSGLVAILLLQVIGCEGNAGKRGGIGDTGDTGDPYNEPIPENRYFALAVGNNSVVAHNGAPKLYLAFDTLHANAGDTVVCQRLTGSIVPEVDGIDGGSAEWGGKSTDVILRKAVLYDNKIGTARVRAAYDENYIYFQVKWTEVADSALGLAVGEDLYPSQWVFDSLPTTVVSGRRTEFWSKVLMGDEDRVMLMFEIAHLTWFEHDGCLVTCHAGTATSLPGTNYHSTKSAHARMDIWSWSSITSNPTGYADDKYMDGTGQIPDASEVLQYTDGMKGDIGRATSMTNLYYVFTTAGGTTTISAYRPLYQSATDPDSLATYPIWDWQMTTYTATGWHKGYAVPSFITTIPTLSRADILSRGKFDNGTWTVEFRRLRATGNGDDAKF
jgi:hypothetical protein